MKKTMVILALTNLVSCGPGIGDKKDLLIISLDGTIDTLIGIYPRELTIENGCFTFWRISELFSRESICGVKRVKIIK